MKIDLKDAAGLYPLVRLLPMVGNPVEENPIDLLFNRFFDREGVPLRFVKLHVESPEDLGVCVEGARKMGFAAMAFTVPYKIAVLPYCDEIAESSQGVGAINFITFEGPERRAVGKNTDGIAICSAIRQKMPIEGKRFLILGAGGAARGIGAEIARQGAAAITIAARKPSEAHAVSGALRRFGNANFTSLFFHWNGALEIPEGTDIVLNATTTGDFPQQAELDLDWTTLARATMAVDVITGPRITPFLRKAHSMDLLTVDGVDMLVDIVEVGLSGFGVSVPREEIAAYATHLTGPPLP